MAIGTVGATADLIVGSTPIVSGTSGRILYDNGSVLGEALLRYAAASLTLGDVDAASPVAQSLSVQNVVTGTSNTAGAAFTIKGSQGTGTGAGGSIIFQTAPAGTTGTSVNALATALTIDSTKAATFVGQILASSGTSAAPGYAYSAEASTGFYWNATKQVIFATNAHKTVMFGDYQVVLASNGVLGFSSSGADPSGGANIAFSFPTSGLMTLGTGAVGDAAGALGLTKLVGGASFSASFPMWKRVSATWAARLGDDSADAAITAAGGTFSGAVVVPGVAVAALTSTGTWTSGAAAGVGTLTNAPASGNPTSWIKIVDNGVTRYIPAW